MSNPRVFGSTLHGDDTETSDLDLLIDFPPQTSLFTIVALELALQDASVSLSISAHPATYTRNFAIQSLPRHEPYEQPA